MLSRKRNRRYSAENSAGVSRENRTWSRYARKLGLLILTGCLFFGQGAGQIAVYAAAKNSQSSNTGKKSTQKTRTTKLSMDIGQKKTLSVKKDTIKKWTSSAKRIVRVTQSGTMIALKSGSAEVTGIGKKYRWVFRITVSNDKVSLKKKDSVTGGASWKKSGSRLSVTVPGAGTRKYKLYKQVGGGAFISGKGCSLVATAIAASAFGDTHSPRDIHNGSASQKWSERYACARLKTNYTSNGVLGLRLCAQILSDMGIPVQLVTKMDGAKSVSQVRNHIRQGKPVLFMCRNQTYKGVRVANSLHAMILAGEEANGKGIFIDPFMGAVNYAHTSKNTFSFSVEEFMKAYCTSMTGNGIYCSHGGYILVG